MLSRVGRRRHSLGTWAQNAGGRPPWWASTLADLLGVADVVPDHVLLVDAGPWGETWSLLRDREVRAEVVDIFGRRWRDRGARALWSALVSVPPMQSDPPMRVAQFLWLQARSAGTIPIWWSDERRRWESPTGARTESAHARGGRAMTEAGGRQDGPAYEAGGMARTRATKVGRAAEKGESSRRLGPGHDRETSSAAPRSKPDHPGCRGVQYPATIAHRLATLASLPWDRVEVVHGDVRDVAPIRGACVLFDPPYERCPRYAALCPRPDVLDVAERWASAGARILVAERVPLPLDGWSTAQLADGEWLTASFPIVVPNQLGLWSAV